uniref:Uncharacterized protein n=1 Tax=Strongyloides venezuelensis TaxID=75913 RepID=A0A0K0FGV2_STRVS
MSDGGRKWNTSQKSFRHRVTSDNQDKKSTSVNPGYMPSIAISIESDEMHGLSRTPSTENPLSEGQPKLIIPTTMPRLHRLTTSQRRNKFMQRTTTLSNEYFQITSSHDDEHFHGPPHILEDLERLSHSSRSSSNSGSIGRSNRPPLLPDGTAPSPFLLQPPDMFKSNIFLLERPPHKQVMVH